MENNRFPEKEYTKTIYSFSTAELANLTPWDVQVQLGIVAQNVIDKILRTVVAKRLALKVSPDTAFEYDTKENKLYVYQPKQVCSLCAIRKAKFSVQDKLYCESCLEILKTQAQQQKEKEELEKKEKKKKTGSK